MMKYKHIEEIIVDVPEQFEVKWQHILRNWLQENHQHYPNAIIEDIQPNIEYYRRSDGEYLMEGDITLTVAVYKDVTNTDFYF